MCENGPVKVVIKSLKYLSLCLFFLLLHRTFPLQELALRGTAVAAAQTVHTPLGPRTLTWMHQGGRAALQRDPLKCKHFLS